MSESELRRVFVGDQWELACPDHPQADALAEHGGHREPIHDLSVSPSRKPPLFYVYPLVLRCTECGRLWLGSMNYEGTDFLPNPFLVAHGDPPQPRATSAPR